MGSDLLSDVHMAVLDDTVAAFAIRDRLVIWHFISAGKARHAKLFFATDPNQGLIIESLEVQVCKLQWIVPVYPENENSDVRSQKDSDGKFSILVVQSSCGLLLLFNMYADRLCTQRIHERQQPIAYNTPVLEEDGLKLQTPTSIISVSAAGLHSYAMQSRKIIDDEEKDPKFKRRDFRLLTHTINLPLKRRTGAASVKSADSLLAGVLSGDSEGHGLSENNILISTGEGPAISWLSCFSDHTNGVPSFELPLRAPLVAKSHLLCHHVVHWMYHLALILQSVWAFLCTKAIASADVTSIIAGLPLHVSHTTCSVTFGM